MINVPMFALLMALMREASQYVLMPEFPMVLELQAIKFESMKKVHFSAEIYCLKFEGMYFQNH